MPTTYSKFETIPFNCYEVAHTWSPYCSKAAFDMGFQSFKEGFKIYATLNFISLVATKRYPKSRDEALKVIKDVLRSSLFLSMNGFGFVMFFCLLRKLSGRFSFLTLGYIPTFLAAYVAIQIERPSRRPLLALYVANVASETVFRMLRARGIVGNIKNFDVFLFCLSAVTLLYQMKKGNRRNDIVDTIFTKIIGNEEFIKPERFEGEEDVSDNVEVEVAPEVGPAGVNIGGLRVGEDAETVRRRINARDQSYRARFIRFVFWMHRNVEDIACHLERMVTAVYEGQIHETCPHKTPCFDYWLHGFWSRFVTGFGIQGAVQTLVFLKNVLTSKREQIDRVGNSLTNSLLYPCIKTGLGLSSMCLAFRLFSCSFRWLKGTEDPTNSIASALMSSSLGFFLLRPPPTLGLYLFFKAAETVISESHRQNDWKIIRWLNSVYGGGWSLLYAAATAMLFHVGMMEPQNLKPSYYHFLSRVTGRRLYDINRHLFSVYGTNSNALMKTFWPNYNEKFLSENMKKIVHMRNAQGRGNEFIKEIVLQVVKGSSA